MRFERALLVVEESRNGSTVRVYLRGELDMATRARVESALIRAEDSGASVIELDLGGLTFMDSSGVHMALDAQDQARASGRELVLLPAPALVQRIFELTETEHRLRFGERVGEPPTGPAASPGSPS